MKELVNVLTLRSLFLVVSYRFKIVQSVLLYFMCLAYFYILRLIFVSILYLVTCFIVYYFGPIEAHFLL